MSDNYGATWKSINSNLPISPINVIREDPENEDILYLGTDNGAYVSFNKGNSWEAFSNGLPNVAVHDKVVQPEAKDIVLGTHGRSIYVANIALLQKLTENSLNSLIVGDLDSVRHSRRWGNSFSTWRDAFVTSLDVQFYSPKSGTAVISVLTEDKTEIKQYTTEVVKGVNIFNYDLSISEKGKKHFEKEDIEVEKAKNGIYYLPKGEYVVKVIIDDQSEQSPLEIK